MLLIFFVVAAVPIGYLARGRLSNYANAPLDWVMLPALAFLLEAFLPKLTGLIPLPLDLLLCIAVSAEYLLLALFVLANRRSRGIKLLGLGCLMNFLAIAFNGFRMPVSPIIHRFPDAAAMAETIRSGEVIRYTLVGWDAPFWFFGDTIPLLGGLASAGDLIMGIAIMLIIIFKMKAPPAETPS